MNICWLDIHRILAPMLGIVSLAVHCSPIKYATCLCFAVVHSLGFKINIVFVGDCMIHYAGEQTGSYSGHLKGKNWLLC